MTLDKFLTSLRLRNQKIKITLSDDKILYEGTVGTYLTSVFRQKNSDMKILVIHPIKEELIIALMVRSDQVCEI